MQPKHYAASHPRCAVCHWPEGRWGRRLHVHHLVGGSGRKNVACNYLRLCDRCHACVHDRIAGFPELPKGSLLTAKQEEDPGNYSPSQMAALKGRRALPYDKREIPREFLEDRTRRGGDPWP